MGRPDGLSRWEWSWCRRLTFSPWHQHPWMNDLLLLPVLMLGVWVVRASGLDLDTALWGGMAGVALGALIARNVPVRSDRVIARLTRALGESADQA